MFVGVSPLVWRCRPERVTAMPDKVQTLWHKHKKTLAFEAFLLPALLIFGTFILYPSIVTIFKSFTNWTDLNTGREQFNGLDNYIRLFHDKSVLIGIRNSFTFAICASIFQSVVGLALALVLDTKFRTRNFLRAVWYFPAVLSTLIIGFLWNYMLSTSDFGLVNQFIQFLGFNKVNFLGNANNAMICIIFVSVWQWAGWTMTIYLANLQSIPADLYEAASLDGASSVQRFLHVTLPMLFPAVSFNLVTGMINGLKVFDIIYALTNGGPNGKTESIVSLMMKKGFTEGFQGYACAMGTVFLVIVMTITVIQQKFLGKWGDSLE